MQAVSIRNLHKIYRNNIKALDGVSFDIHQGDFFALLGPNGAGKSTIINILTSLVMKSKGQVQVLGHDLDREVHEVRKKLGLVPQEFNFNLFEKNIDILTQQAGYYGIPRKLALKRSEKYLKLLGIWSYRNEVPRSLSGGLKRRLLIARAMVHEPPILIFDEPTAGVDVELRKVIWNFLTELNRAGKTIILTTHYLEEAEKLCRRVAIIDRGKIIVQSTIDEIIDKLPKIKYLIKVHTKNSKLDVSQLSNGFSIVATDADSFEVTLDKGTDFNGLIEIFNRQNISIKSIRSFTNPLESAFLHYTEGKES